MDIIVDINGLTATLPLTPVATVQASILFQVIDWVVDKDFLFLQV